MCALEFRGPSAREILAPRVANWRMEIVGANVDEVATLQNVVVSVFFMKEMYICMK